MPLTPDTPKDTLTILRVASYTIGTIIEPSVPTTCEDFCSGDSGVEA
jgi:hypothetical protein